MREIVFDTETTGLAPDNGDRIIEIGAVELENRFLTGRTFHAYVNPGGRAIDAEAEAIHGLSNRFLADKPTFAEIVDDLLTFVGDARLVAHNAAFDLAFLNAELARAGLAPLAADRVIDTLMLARRRHPMGPNSLDALCQRYGIDNSRRTRHGALLDSELLAEVYVELNGGRQASLLLDAEGAAATLPSPAEVVAGERRRRPAPLAPRLSQDDVARHRAFVATLGDGAVWNSFL
ncbi:MAG: DNA polymerase III subunit epsilon [Alphaproteobacteria bacterium]|nr:MAG: DNA polymerase III subunit epsilon [Alphaproteobacteria bacterium]